MKKVLFTALYIALNCVLAYMLPHPFVKSVDEKMFYHHL